MIRTRISLDERSIQEAGKEELAKVRPPHQEVCRPASHAGGCCWPVLMNECRTGTCWSTDRHLALTGAELVV